jgi:hypothetical protein
LRQHAGENGCHGTLSGNSPQIGLIYSAKIWTLRLLGCVRRLAAGNFVIGIAASEGITGFELWLPATSLVARILQRTPPAGLAALKGFALAREHRTNGPEDDYVELRQKDFGLAV